MLLMPFKDIKGPGHSEGAGQAVKKILTIHFKFVEKENNGGTSFVPVLFDITGCDISLSTHKTKYKVEVAIVNTITIKLRKTEFGPRAYGE